MKIGIVSHCTIDSIIHHNIKIEQIGGPAYYGGIISKNLGFDVKLYTKFGNKFPYENKLLQNNLVFENSAISSMNTTKFKIIVSEYRNVITLENLCEPITDIDKDQDGIIISPVFNEIDKNILNEIKNKSNFIFIDPSGFLRKTNQYNEIFLQETKIDFLNISTIKVTHDECFKLTHCTGKTAMLYLQKLGIKNIILINNNEILMLVKNKLFSINNFTFNSYKQIGLIDIFNAAFYCTLLKENDLLWALCFGGGVIESIYDSNEFIIKKIPSRNMIENNAAYLYNLLKFEQI